MSDNVSYMTFRRNPKSSHRLSRGICLSTPLIFTTSLIQSQDDP